MFCIGNNIANCWNYMVKRSRGLMGKLILGWGMRLINCSGDCVSLAMLTYNQESEYYKYFLLTLTYTTKTFQNFFPEQRTHYFLKTVKLIDFYQVKRLFQDLKAHLI